MQFLSSVFILISVAVCDAELKLEATDGENVTISFKTAELKRADRVRITFTGENPKTLIGQYCRCAHCGDCDVVETPGVLLRIEEGTFILLNVSSESSGLYEAQVFNGNNVSKKTATLVVKPPLSSSRVPPQTSISKPPQTSTSKPPNSSERQRLYVLVAPVFVFGVLGVCFFCTCMREREALPDVEEARETPAVSSTASSKNKWKRNCSDCAAVSFKACRDQLVDT